LCGALSPYIKNYSPDFQFIKKQVDSFFDIIGYVGVIDISGGEPLSVQDLLCDLLNLLGSHYKNRYNKVRIFTNGTIVPNDKLCEIMSTTPNFYVTLDDYGIHSTKLKQIAAKLKNYDVDFIIRDYAEEIHCGGWVDLLDMSLKNNDDEAQILYKNCAIPQKCGCCLELFNGICTPCSVVAARYICGEIDAASEDIIDLSADTDEMYTKLQNLISIDRQHAFESCRYCNGGMCDSSKRFKPAQQAAKSEIEQFISKYSMRM
jgi:hypothetical protein